MENVSRVSETKNYIWKMNGSGFHSQCPGILLSGALALVLIMAGQGVAEVRATDHVQEGSAHEIQGPVPADEFGQRPNQSPALFQTPSEWWNTRLNWETGAGRSYLLPAVEIPAYLFLLNQFDRHFTEPTAEYRTTGATFWQHVTDPHWVIDNDQFSVNQFLHPYGGSIYYGLARSAGLNFWESFLYSTARPYIPDPDGSRQQGGELIWGVRIAGQRVYR